MARTQGPGAVAKPPAGVLPMSLVNTASSAQANGNTSKDVRVKPVPQKLKVVIRRLPPGLTQEEFEAALGDDWKLGMGKVSWYSYRPGKMSKDFSKHSKPAYACLQLTEHGHFNTLIGKVRETTFNDAKKTENDSVLIAPPTVDWALYGRIPVGRRRNDARQGLIDQDPEFKEFLESLTNPITKPPPPEASEVPLVKDEAFKVTPLIQHLRDKKAAKEKEKVSGSKTSKHVRQGSKSDASETLSSSNAPSKMSAGTLGSEKKTPRAARAEKAQAKQGKKESSVKTIAASAASISTSSNPQPPAATPSKRADVAPGAAAARMLQRDLGLKGGQSERGGRRAAGRGRGGTSSGSTVALSDTVPAQVAPGPIVAASTQPEATPSAPVKPAILKRDVPREPVPATVTAPKVAHTTSTAKAAVKAANPAPARINKPTVNPTSKQAFLKHANPSQGITEALLEEAFAPFGSIAKVEIDKRKGFAYIDFVEPEGLQKAVAASPVKVAQGSVQVLERKERGIAPSLGSARGSSTVLATRGGLANVGVPVRGARGGRGRGGTIRGGAQTAGAETTTAVESVQIQAVQTAKITPSSSAAPIASATNDSLADIIPTGPRAMARKSPVPQTLPVIAHPPSTSTTTPVSSAPNDVP